MSALATLQRGAVEASVFKLIQLGGVSVLGSGVVAGCLLRMHDQ